MAGAKGLLVSPSPGTGQDHRPILTLDGVQESAML